MRAPLLRENERMNEGRCQLAVRGVCTGKATQVHHTLGVERTGHDPRFMVAACAECNLHVGDPLRQPNPPPAPSSTWL